MKLYKICYEIPDENMNTYSTLVEAENEIQAVHNALLDIIKITKVKELKQ